ncbi:MAG: GTPase [Planctomycetota bacterium]
MAATFEPESLGKTSCSMARLTPAGRGAVAVVGLRGPTAVLALATCFKRAAGGEVAAIPVGRGVFGRWRGNASSAGEDVVVARLTDDLWEIHCHGGEAAVVAVMEALAERGAVRQQAAAWCLGEQSDPLAAAAFEAWPLCLTERTSAWMAVQAGGALRRAFQEIFAAISAVETIRALALLDTLIARAPCGLHLAQPWRVALVGRPNAGKSSLINRLVGYERAIVSPIPGTTRDVVAATTAWQGWHLWFADTAGLRTTADELEAAGIERSRASQASADLTIHVADLSQPWTEDDWQLTLSLDERPTLLAHNKADLVTQDLAIALADRPPGIAISAQTGLGLERLLDAIIERLVPAPPAVDDALPFSTSIVMALDETRRWLAAGQHALAASRLAEFL